MKEYIMSPFYSIQKNKLFYLNRFEICELPKEENIRQNILKDEGAILYKYKIDNNEKNDSILVIEPHPDDFALSALGYLDNKKSAIIMNIFSKMNIDSFTWNDKISITEDEYEEIRIKEDKFAIEEILGQHYVSLREKSTRITDKSIDYITNTIVENLEKMINQNPNINTLMIPMGIGRHPDHIVTYNSIMNYYINRLNRKIKIVLYPEYPYARCKKFYRDRLEEIQKKYKLKVIIKDVEEKLDGIVNTVSVYRSQYNDVNRIQMLAVIREDCIAIAEEFNKQKISLVYYEVERERKLK